MSRSSRWTRKARPSPRSRSQSDTAREGGALLLPLVGGGEQPRGLVDGQQIRILVEQGEGQIAALQTGTQRHGLAGDEGMVVTGDCLPIHQHLPPGEQRFDVVAALPLLVGEQKGKQGVRPVHREDGGLFWRIGSDPFIEVR